MGSVEHVHVAVVDDDEVLADLVRQRLEQDGYQLTVFSDALPFLTYVREYGLPHLAIIDLALPGMEGFELSEQLKALGDVPIIFISGRHETETVVKGLQLYAEDYLRKPFDMDELAARVYRVLSRIPSFAYAGERIIHVDEWLAIDFSQGILYTGEQSRALTPIEANILYVLVRNAGQVVPTRLLLSRVWPLKDVYEDTLRVHMHRLRQKIEPAPHAPRYIHTVRGVGYQFDASERRGRQPSGESPPDQTNQSRPH